ncbi:MAG: L-fucose/L-arabinose isomerase family protein [Opitutaceae bacterium]|nr:L-fucose/L-arabinose isomerase family protein [Opitutaceae bacterium]
MNPTNSNKGIKLGLLFLGRKRPGFDMEWGAGIEIKVREAVNQSNFEVFEPSKKAVDEVSLKEVVAECEDAGVEALVLLQTTMADGRMAPTLAQIWPYPPIFWATPEKPEGNMISSCSLVGAHLWASSFRQMGRSSDVVYGDPEDSETLEKLDTSVRSVAVVRKLRHTRVGVIGGQAPGFANMATDPFAMHQLLGVQLQTYSLIEFENVLKDLSEDAVSTDVETVKEMGLEFKDASEADLPMASRLYLAMRHFFDEENLDALGVRCWPEMPNTFGQWPYLGIARLADEGRAIACEGDADGAIGALIGETFGMGRCYLSDWLEHDEETITLWHVGAMPPSLSPPAGESGAPKIAKHFNVKKPTVLESELKVGIPLTLFRLWRCDGEYRLTACDAESVKARPLMCSNGRARLLNRKPNDWFEDMCRAGMPHHLNIFQGNHAAKLKRFAAIAGIRWFD